MYLDCLCIPAIFLPAKVQVSPDLFLFGTRNKYCFFLSSFTHGQNPLTLSLFISSSLFFFFQLLHFFLRRIGHEIDCYQYFQYPFVYFTHRFIYLPRKCEAILCRSFGCIFYCLPSSPCRLEKAASIFRYAR